MRAFWCFYAVLTSHGRLEVRKGTGADDDHGLVWASAEAPETDPDSFLHLAIDEASERPELWLFQENKNQPPAKLFRVL